MLDFNKYQFGLRGYDGHEKKKSLIINNKYYMVKFSERIKENDLASSYANNVFSEYISCNIIKSMDFSVQNTILGIYNDRIGVACEDFVPNGYKLIEFMKLENSYMDSDNIKRTPQLNNVIDILNKHELLESIRQEALERFWDTFIIDSLIGNFDRHSGNWGYLVNENTKDVKLAPIYDCGSSLYPGLSDDGIKKIINDDEEIYKRIYDFPRSTLLVKGEKIKYHDYIHSLQNKNCSQSLIRVFESIDMDKINDIVNQTPLISDVKKEFLSLILEERCNKILKANINRCFKHIKDTSVPNYNINDIHKDLFEIDL